MLAIALVIGAILSLEPPRIDPLPALRADITAGAADLTQPRWTAPLTKAQAEEVRTALWQDHLARLRESRAAEWNAKSITLDGQTLKFELKTFGEKPASGRSLFISMHGGGNAPAGVNDQQWRNQVRLYEPAEGVYIAPRAPTNTWNLWHEAHIDPLFDRLIENAVALADVDPNRVYLMGYSAGGDGVYQIAPRMADRFAAVAMMAGHPNEASPLGLRNLPFAIHVGEKDGGFNRNKVARGWGEQLAALRAADPGGYEHVVEIHAGRGHWMNREDARAVPWMAKHTRNPVPRRVVWRQDDVTHPRLYWLAVDQEHRKAGTLLIASVEGQRVTIEKAEGLDGATVTVLLDDRLVDLDKPVTIAMGGEVLSEGTPRRTAGDLARSLAERGDREMMFAARLAVRLADAPSADPQTR